MVRELKRYKFDRSGFPSVITKKPSKISLGFEWEVQSDDCEYNYYADKVFDRLGWDNNTLTFNSDRATTLDRYSIDFVKMYSFRVHGECTASEFASPVFHHLLTAKAMANKLIKRTHKDPFLLPDESEMAGIHVHTSVPEWCGWGSQSNYSTDFEKLLMMCNRQSSQDFILNFSGREEWHDYFHQAEATCWDTEHWSDKPRDDQVKEAANNEMLRENCFGEKRTVEFRIWNGVADRLLPAIEFSHAATRFVRQHTGKSIPYMTDLKKWLGKQKGYKLLKEQPEWKLVI
jgi:hypothetical protein